jgi:hypothetical protein
MMNANVALGIASALALFLATLITALNFLMGFSYRNALSEQSALEYVESLVALRVRERTLRDSKHWLVRCDSVLMRVFMFLHYAALVALFVIAVREHGWKLGMRCDVVLACAVTLGVNASVLLLGGLYTFFGMTCYCSCQHVEDESRGGVFVNRKPSEQWQVRAKTFVTIFRIVYFVGRMVMMTLFAYYFILADGVSGGDVFGVTCSELIE